MYYKIYIALIHITNKQTKQQQQKKYVKYITRLCLGKCSVKQIVESRLNQTNFQNVSFKTFHLKFLL